MMDSSPVRDETAEETEDEEIEEASDIDDDAEDAEFKINSDTSDSDSMEEMEEQEGTDETEDWISKSGLSWSPSHEETLEYFPAPTGLAPGPTRYAISQISTLKSAFDLFLTDDMLQLVLKRTNLHGREFTKGWKDIDLVDLEAYIGLLLLAGVYRSRSENVKSLWDDQTGRAIFRATMSCGMFSLIGQNIRFDRKAERAEKSDDKLAAIRELWDQWTDRLPLLFNPSRDICIDEQLVPFKGHCRFRQYMPKKPGKYGIKIWVACDVPTNYVWRMQVYLGKAAGDAPEVGQGKRVVIDLTKGLRGHTVTCDNFFTSHALAQELLKRKMALVGTIRSNKPELPPQLLRIKKRAVLSSLFAFTKNTTFVSYVPKRGKNVTLLSTKHRRPVVNRDDKKKPEIITDYNSCKGAVDTLDKLVGTYSCHRKTRRWPLAMFFNILDVSACNAYVLWTAVDPTWFKTKSVRRRVFLEELGKSLVNPQIARRTTVPRSPFAAAIVKAARTVPETDDSGPEGPSPKKRKVCFCCIKKKRKVYNVCCKCEKHICREHMSTICLSCCP
ncbi:piggyBac transposable element-derived protein 4-like [Notolabrus celidotus]|uniref:piggyBac transposable element-derived protein 4-like n=1 Tax=Notolabrus celidotus TaxID=1203425 RepID=UPI0014904766|nr:piggyBac transposable element-derived protein 4-like [Notolabrus celidotus]